MNFGIEIEASQLYAVPPLRCGAASIPLQIQHQAGQPFISYYSFQLFSRSYVQVFGSDRLQRADPKTAADERKDYR